MKNGSSTGALQRRVMIFIDGSNLYHVLNQNIEKHALDYKKFAEKLCGDRQLIRTYYYNIRQESSDNPRLAENQDRFLNALYETNYLEVKLGIWKPRGQTMVEKGVDVMIASDLISHAYEDHYDIAILVSGDADFYPALQAVKDVGKQVEVAAFDSNLSSEAARLSDVLIRFDNAYFEGLWMSDNYKNRLTRTAALRRKVSDEDASPNGEDKGSSRGGSGRRFGGSENKNQANGKSAIRRTESRRRIGLPANGISRRYTTPARERASSNLNHRSRVNGRPVPPSISNSNEARSSANGAVRDAGDTSSKNLDSMRESWISRMFRSRR